MTRWKRLKSRLILLALFAVFVLLALDPLVRWSILAAASSALCATSTANQIRWSLRDGTVELTDFKAAAPNDSEHVMLRADRVRLEIDPSALRWKKIHVRRAQVAGLKLVPPHVNPPIRDVTQTSQVAKELEEMLLLQGGAWFRQAEDKLNRAGDVELSAASMAEEFGQRWRVEYQLLEQEAEQLTQRIETLQSGLDSIGNNPLRNAASYQQAADEIAVLTHNLADVRARADQWLQQMMMDRDAVRASHDADLSQLQRQMDMVEINPEALNAYLLDRDVREWIRGLMHSISISKTLLPAVSNDAFANPGIGRDILLPGQNTDPDVRIDTLVFQGVFQDGTQELNVEGTVTGLTSHPERTDTPIEFVVQTTGHRQFTIQATVRHSPQGLHEHYVINCPTFDTDERQFGSSSLLTLRVAPSQAHMWATIDVCNGQLSGELIIKQHDVHLQPVFPLQSRSERLAVMIVDAARRQERLEVAAVLGGSVESPRFQIRSNLGCDLANQLDQNFRQQWVAERLEQARGRLEQSTAQLNQTEQLIRGNLTELIRTVEQGSQAVNMARANVAARVGQADSPGSPNSPLRDTLQR